MAVRVVTLGRVRSVSDKGGLLEKVSAIKNEVESMKDTFRIGSFKLVESTLTPNGPMYHDLEVLNLS